MLLAFTPVTIADSRLACSAYMYRLTLEYSRILNHDDADNSELDYFLPPDVIVDFD